jgi:hypothetical protein
MGALDTRFPCRDETYVAKGASSRPDNLAITRATQGGDLRSMVGYTKSRH